MRVEVITRSEDEVESCDYRNAIEIKIDGKCVFRASDGEPEDATLNRDFNDVYGIADLLKMAYDAGKAGNTFELINTTSDEI